LQNSANNLYKSMETIYIAGPMTGYPEFNFPAFDKAKETLKQNGWEVLSPADIDREMGFDPTGKTGNEALPIGMFENIVRRDVEAILQSDSIYMLSGWQNSRGARAELGVAEWLGIQVIFENDEDAADYFAKKTGISKPKKNPSILETAMEITNGDRRRDYDSATPNHGRIAELWNSYISVRKNPEAEISAFDVAIMMVLLKIARIAYTPTFDGFVDMAGYSKCAAQIAGFEKED
jgi:nucleoside 2-deoxyribosyltransferase